MYINFDSFDYLDKPQITLCNPNQVELYSLGNIYNMKLSLKYNTLSEFTFDIGQTIQDANGNDIIDPAYALLKSKRLVKIENFGFFQIVKTPDKRDVKVPTKSVSCVSWESELVMKQVSALSGDFLFQDFLEYILSGTGWDINYVDNDLLDLQRSFDVSSSNVYNILMTTAETAYGCIFTFEPFEKLVNAIAVPNATTDTSIYLSFENLLKQTTFDEISEEITTVLEVFGGDGLDIRSVNPLGTNKIYDFTYYQSRDDDTDQLLWMSEGLNLAIELWEDKILANQPTYANYLTQLSINNINLGIRQAELSILQDELDALIQVQKVRIEGNLPYDDINTQIDAKNLEITAKNNQINTLNNNITSITAAVVTINNNLSLTYDGNFTPSQQYELRSFMFENVYQNENIVITDIMRPPQIQRQAQALYNQAKTVLGKTSQPRYEFSVDAANFVALKEYQVFTQQLELGSNVTIENQEGIFITTAVLEINLSFDNLDDFSLVFSNRLRLDNGSFINSDLFNQVVNSSTSVSFNSGLWSGYNNNKNNILNIGDILNTANNQIINSSNQEITIADYGLRGKRKLDNGTYSNDQIWITSNLINFSDDGFKTSRLALGRISIPGGGTKFGLAGEAIFGNLLAGNSLKIYNSGNNFVLDQNGCTLQNASFIINQSNAKNSLELSATNGFLLKNKVGQIIISTNGNGDLSIVGAVTANSGSFTGSITASSGKIGPLTIDSLGLSDAFGNYIRNGSFKLGPLSVNGSNGTFDGTLQADRLVGYISSTNNIRDNSIAGGKITSLEAEKIMAGNIYSVNIWGGSITSGNTVSDPAVRIYGDDYFATIAGSGGVVITGSDATTGQPTGHIETQIFMNGGNILIGCPMESNGNGEGGLVALGLVNNNVSITGNKLDLTQLYAIETYAGLGVNGTYRIQVTNVGTFYFKWVMGILISVTTGNPG